MGQKSMLSQQHPAPLLLCTEHSWLFFVRRPAQNPSDDGQEEKEVTDQKLVLYDRAHLETGLTSLDMLYLIPGTW